MTRPVSKRMSTSSFRGDDPKYRQVWRTYLIGKRNGGHVWASLMNTTATEIPIRGQTLAYSTCIIADVRTIQYPEGICRPRPELNENAQQGKFRYDREFLLQFMPICKTKPPFLIPLDAFSLDPTAPKPVRSLRLLERFIVSPVNAPRTQFSPRQLSEDFLGRRANTVVNVILREMVGCKVKTLLEELTTEAEKFDSISDKIIGWENMSVNEKDGQTLVQVIRLVFEKAMDEAQIRSQLYARLCQKMMVQINPKVQDHDIKNNDGKPIAGGQLCRKYLIIRCQEDLGRIWKVTEASENVTVAETIAHPFVNAAKENTKEDDEQETYSTQKARQRHLALVNFVGELFKLRMITDRIMHECIRKLLGNVGNPADEEIESLYKLLTMVGGILDNTKGRAHFDIRFSRMKELAKSPGASSRMQHLFIDLIELRGRRWTANSPERQRASEDDCPNS